MHFLRLERERLEPEHVLVRDQRTRLRQLELGQLTACHANLQRGEQHVFDARRDVVRGAVVQRPPLLLEQASEGRLVAGERTVAAAHAVPGLADLDVDPNRERVLAKEPARSFREHGTATECDHPGPRGGEHLRRELLLATAERRLTALEQCGDRPVAALDLAVEVDERASALPGDLLADRRLARAHEADEREVPPERTYLGDQSIRSRYARCAETKSPSASPPNLSFDARASSKATHASATTASASTAAVSLRSTSAWAASPV